MSEKDSKKKLPKNLRDNLRTSMQQKAYQQLIAKEKGIVYKKELLEIEKLNPIISSNNNYLAVLRKDHTFNKNIDISTTINNVKIIDNDEIKKEIELNLEHIKPNNKLPMFKEIQDYVFCNKDKKDKLYNKHMFLNRKNNKEIYTTPIRSSDAYGWLPPIDTLTYENKFGIKTIEGADQLSSLLKKKRINKT